MISSRDKIENSFFLYLADELSLPDFEQWIYSTPQIEEYLGGTAYLELVSFDFHQPAASCELTKIITQYVSQAKFIKWHIMRHLQSLLDGTHDPVDAFEKLYDLYSRGYSFLGKIGIEYDLGVYEIPKLTEQHLWNEKEFFRRRKMLDDHVLPLKKEIITLLQALEKGEIAIPAEREYANEAGASKELRKTNQAKGTHDPLTPSGGQPMKSGWDPIAYAEKMRKSISPVSAFFLIDSLQAISECEQWLAQLKSYGMPGMEDVQYFRDVREIYESGKCVINFDYEFKLRWENKEFSALLRCHFVAREKYEIELWLPGVLANEIADKLKDGYQGFFCAFMPPAFYD